VIAIGMGMFWAGYTGVLWGVMLITGKNCGLSQVLGSTWPPQVPGASGTGTSAGPQSSSAGTSTGKGTPVIKLNNGRRITGTA